MVKPAWRPALPQLLAVALLTAFAIYQAVGENNFQDFFIYRSGAVIALRGESPYDLGKVRARVADQYPDDKQLIANCGFFLPPEAVVLFAPFAALPYPVAKVAWAAVAGLAALGVLLLPRLFGRERGERDRLWLAATAVVFAVLLGPTLTLETVAVGQTTLVFVGSVAVGQWCFERGRSAIGSVLWAVPFVKPHLALPLLPLAWYLGGWKRAAAVAGVVVALTMVGGLIAGGTPLFVREYLDFLRAGHKAVAFNRVELNPQVTSWNRLVFAAGGLLVEQSAATTLAGYVVWLGLVAGRCALTGKRPSRAWAMAAAAVGGVLCSQVLAYEVLTLALVTPWLLDLIADRRRVWAAGVILLMLVQWVPYLPVQAWVEGRQVGEPAEALLLSYRAAAVLLIAAVVLTGPAVRRADAGPAQS